MFSGSADGNRAVFNRRRRRLLRQLGGGVALLPAAPGCLRSNDTEFPFRQDSDFYYLTGFPEPEAVAVLHGSGRRPGYLLFVRPRDPKQETWTGRRVGPEGACRLYGADEAYTLDKLEEMLPGIIAGCDHVYLALGKHPEFDNRVTRVINRQRWQSRRGVRAPAGVVDVREILHEMRLVKTADEIELIRRAARISAEGHLAAMRACRPGMFEYELAALIEYVFKKNGAAAPAYATIVGSAENGTILHYIENTRCMEQGDLVLIDAGAEFDFFSGDITRTFPVSGRFSTPQQEIYEIVLGAQKAAIRAVGPGATVKRVHDAAVRALVRGLVDLGLLEGDVAALIKERAYERFYMHGTSHWLGMDVHDVGRYRDGKTWRELEPGMVLTVEPGLYLAPELKGVPRRYQGLAVRIEDDVLVTREGREVLTAGVPKEIGDIEAVMTETVQIQV